MKKEFVELVFDCPFILFKGFLRGFITCREEKVEYFFSKLAGIESETLKESLKEWLGLESHVHLCIQQDFANYLKKAVEMNFEKLKIKLVSEREIKEAFFSFSFAFFEEKALNEFRTSIEEAMKECPGCVVDFEKSEGYEPLVDDFGGGIAPVIPGKRYFLEGEVKGYLPDVIKMREFMLSFKVGQFSKVRLQFKDKNM